MLDFKNLDYIQIFEQRLEALNRLRKNSDKLAVTKQFYKDNPAQFIIDWGVTFDPRNVGQGRPAMLPFILYPRQVDWVHWLLERWKKQENGLSDKTRGVGLSWLACALSVTLCLFHNDLTISFGSRKEALVDAKDDPNSLFWKMRQFIYHLPEEFQGGWDIKKHAPHMRIVIPQTLSTITGEAGDNIGRGGRSSIAFVDESAHLEHPMAIEASLSQTTKCRIDISTPWGMANPFAIKRFSGNISVFTFHWRDDPTKDQAWYEKECKRLNFDEVLISQELDLNYQASVRGILIPAVWVQAAIDAHIKLGFQPTGQRVAALDIADEGPDRNAYIGRHGVVVQQITSWSGEGSNIFKTVKRAFVLSDLFGYREIIYDADGLGAGARGDAEVLNEEREKEYHADNPTTREAYKPLDFIAFHGSGAVTDPERLAYENMDANEDTQDRTNKNLFANAKAQGWFELRRRFELTYRAVVEKQNVHPDDLISISSDTQNFRELVTELSQPVYSLNNAGKLIVDKAPEGMRSPNHADACMMVFARRQAPPAGVWDLMGNL